MVESLSSSRQFLVWICQSKIYLKSFLEQIGLSNVMHTLILSQSQLQPYFDQK